MIAFAVESMGGTVVGAGLVARGARAKSSTARPSPVTGPRTSLDGRGQAPVWRHQSAGAGSWDARRVARAMASLMGIGHHVEIRLVPQLRQHLCTEAVQVASHSTAETRSSGVETPPQWRHGDVPHPAVQVAGPAAAVVNLQDPCRKESTDRDQGKQRLQRFRVDAEPVGVDRLGRTRGRCPASAAYTPRLLEMDVIGRGRQLATPKM